MSAEKEKTPAKQPDEKTRVQMKKDEEYKANEIKFGIRKKLVILFSGLIFTIALGITFIATRQQTNSLLEEKEKQGQIIVRGLTAAIKTRLIDVYASQAGKIEKLRNKEEYREFYQKNNIDQMIFEDLDQVTTQPDVIYAYILGKHGVVLGHTNQKIIPYTFFEFSEGTESYLKVYETAGERALKPVLKEITAEKTVKPTSPASGNTTGAESKPAGEVQKVMVDALDFSYALAFKSDPKINDAIGEVHIGISLESVNKQIFETKVYLQLIGLLAIAFGVFTAIVLAALIARPVQMVIEGMRAVSEGNFSASVVVKSKDEIGLLSRTFNVMLKGMSILVSPEVAQVVLAGGDLLKGGQKRTVTVLFSDVRGFTTISESLTPHEVVLMLNNYLEIMTDIIIKYGGVVDKFVGDEIFAVFGAPFDHPCHPLAACATALDMGVELGKHNDERKQQGKLPIGIGIGLNTGEVISGAMGSTKRIDYTSIGDAVNLGARLEGTNKVYSTLCIVSEFTYEVVKNDIIVRELDSIKVKGKNKPVLIFELMALTSIGEQKVQQYLAELNAEREAKTGKTKQKKKSIFRKNPA